MTITALLLGRAPSRHLDEARLESGGACRLSMQRSHECFTSRGSQVIIALDD
jgi:hypothetical protein